MLSKIIIIYILISGISAHIQCSNYLGAFQSSGVIWWNTDPNWLIGYDYASKFGLPEGTLLLYATSEFSAPEVYRATISIDLPDGTFGYINMTYDTITDCSDCFVVKPEWDDYIGYISSTALQSCENKWANITYIFFPGSNGTHKVGLEISRVSTTGKYLAMRSIQVTACYEASLSLPPIILVLLIYVGVIVSVVLGLYIIKYLRCRRFNREGEYLDSK